MIRGTSAVLLSLNGPLSSGYAGTRAFLNPNIRGRQEFHKSQLLSGWEHHLRMRTSRWRTPASASPFISGGHGRQELGTIKDVNSTVTHLFYFTDFCISYQPTHYFCSSEVCSPH